MPWLAKVGTSAPHTGAEPKFRLGIDGAELAEKRCGTTKNNFRTSAPKEIFPFEW